jgi:hypothetical protein
MARVPEVPGAQGTQFYRVMAHRPELLEHWHTMRQTIWERSLIGPGLIEQMRLMAALLQGCEH